MVAELRNELTEKEGLEGCTQLLSILSSGGMPELRLPLSKRRLFIARLRGTNRSQLVASGCVVVLGMGLQIAAGNPVSSALLDQRLFMQQQWRVLTSQPFINSPSNTTEPVSVMVLDNRANTLTLPKNSISGRVNRFALAKVIKEVNRSVEQIGLDVILVEDIDGTQALAQQIKQQKRNVIAGHYSSFRNLDPRIGAGVFSRPTEKLLQAGLRSRDLTVGTPTKLNSYPKQKPLQLIRTLGADQFAVALSHRPNGRIPNGAIIDWSINWDNWIHWVRFNDLNNLNTTVLLVGRSGHQLAPEFGEGDRFQIPHARRETLSTNAMQYGDSNRVSIPGVHVQAVLIQSLNLQHWLEESDLTLITSLMAAVGVILAAAIERKSVRFGIICGTAVISVPLTLQIAISVNMLIPWLLPLTALSAGALIRND